jgi:hypothetical protein
MEIEAYSHPGGNLIFKKDMYLHILIVCLLSDRVIK